MSKEKEISEMRSLFLANKGFTVLFSLAPCDSAEQNNPVNCFARGGVGTLVEPVKYEPRETACRMAEGGHVITNG